MDILAALVSDIEAGPWEAECSQMVLGLACLKVVDIGVVDTAELAGYSQWAEHPRKRHGGTFRQTCARRWVETVLGSHTESVRAESSLVAGNFAEGILAEGSLAEGSLAADIAGNLVQTGDIVVGLTVEGSRCSELGSQPYLS